MYLLIQFLSEIIDLLIAQLRKIPRERFSIKLVLS